MSQVQVFQLIILFVLLLLSAIFSASETAIFSANKVKIRHLAEEGNRQAVMTRRLLEQPGKSISTILIGNNVVNIGATALATVLAISFFGSSGAGIATIIMSVLILVFGEITPKTLASRRAEDFALRMSHYIYGLGKILSPFIYVFNVFTNTLLRLLDASHKEKHFITEEELRMLVNVGEEEGFIDEDEREMIDSIFEFDDTLVREVMVPRIDIDAIDVEETLENTIKLVLKAGRSRIPVYEQSVDNIIGVIYAKDLLQIFFEPHREKIKLKEIMRPAYYVPESKKVRDLFAELRKEKVHMAIVLDEYGGTAGLVTIEDAIEEIVGDIQDEYDREEKAIEKLSDGSFLVDARTPIYEINEVIGIALPDDEFETISGYVFHNLGRLPVEGQIIKVNDLEIKIEQITGRRIGKLRLKKVI
ncbi:MAG TPA: HlyC/CorC family transporter [Clostridia bacterium]|nr:HlyC/CorC family transporter [Clostridia bacterium]